MGEPAKKHDSVYDNNYSEKPVTRPELGLIHGEGQASGPPQGDLHAVPDNSSKANQHDASSAVKKDDLKSAEEAADSPSTTRSEAQESAAVGHDTVGSGYRHEGGKGSKGHSHGFMGRRRMTYAVISGAIITVIMVLLGILQGPLELVHFAHSLQKFHLSNNEEFADGRAGRYMRHLFSGQSERARLGSVKNAIADRVETRLNKKSGVKSVYSNPPSRRLIGYEVIDSTKAQNFIDEMQREGVNTNGTARGSANPQNRFIDIETNSRGGPIRARGATRAAVRGSGYPKIGGRIASRLLIKRGGVDFHPLKNVKRKSGEKLLDYYDKRKKERSERRKHGVNAPDKRTKGTREERKNEAGEGTGEYDDTEDLSRQGNEVIDEGKKAQDPKTRLKLAGKLAGAAASAVGAMCVIQDINQSIVQYKYDNIILVMMRMGMEIVTKGNQVMSNIDTNLDEVGMEASDFYDKEAKDGEKSWKSAASIQYEEGRNPTGPDLPIGSKLDKSSEGPVFFDAVSKAPGLERACKLEEQAKEIPLLGKALKFADEVVEDGINVALRLVDTSIEEIMDTVVRVLAGEVVNTYAKGAELGNIASHGARLAANDQAIAMGGRELDENEEKERDKVSRAEYHRELASKSFFERVLDPYNVDSITATAIRGSPSSPRQAVTSLIRAPANLVSNLSGLISNPVGAQGNTYEYDYGFNEYGFSVGEQESNTFENPFDNAEKMEANNNERLRKANEKYGKCFSMKIDPETGNLRSGQAKKYDEIEKDDDCNDGSEELLRYRFYLADLVTAHSLACYEGVENSCTQAAGNGQVASGGDESGSGSSPPPVEEGEGGAIVGDIGHNSDNVPCPPGTRDMGVATSNYNGSAKKESGKMRIRLCQIPVIDGYGQDKDGNRVSGGAVQNSRVAGAWLALGNQAKADGVPLKASSSFRLGDSCGGTGDGGRCARRGGSYHQLGVAIDFMGTDVMGPSSTSCNARARDPGSPTWSWLYKNAERYGFKQYTKESWHWDPGKDANRCGTGQ